MDGKKIRFSDLSTVLKIGITLAWIVGIMYTLLFLFGFISGLMGV
jgi:hypothetical protein